MLIHENFVKLDCSGKGICMWYVFEASSFIIWQGVEYTNGRTCTRIIARLCVCAFSGTFSILFCFPWSQAFSLVSTRFTLSLHLLPSIFSLPLLHAHMFVYVAAIFLPLSSHAGYLSSYYNLGHPANTRRQWCFSLFGYSISIWTARQQKQQQGSKSHSSLLRRVCCSYSLCAFLHLSLSHSLSFILPFIRQRCLLATQAFSSRSLASYPLAYATRTTPIVSHMQEFPFSARRFLRRSRRWRLPSSSTSSGHTQPEVTSFLHTRLTIPNSLFLHSIA